MDSVHTSCRRPTAAALFPVLLLLIFAPTSTVAGTTGKLAGRVLDKNKEPLPAANVVLVGTSLGAAADIEGYFTIINIPPGKYRVQFSLVGYRPHVVQEVLITTDQTTKLDVALEENVVTTDAVVVTAQRPVVEVNLTSSLASLTSQDIEALPVQELQDVVNLQAGVVDGHFRGGRLGEVQYQVNGVSINNLYDNSSSLRIDRSLLQEVQVISGTFDAEYGQAMSGVVNAVLKSGSEEFRWNLESYIGDYVHPDDTKRGVDDELRPTTLQNYQLSMSGPVGLPHTYFLLSGRWFQDNGWVAAERRFLPTDSADFEQKVFTPTGDNAELPLGYYREWSGLGKITNKSLEGIEISYSALFNYGEGKRADYAFRLNPDGLSLQRVVSLVHGLDWTHSLSSATFYTVNVRQNYFDYRDYVYEDVYDPRYYDAGPPLGDQSYELGAVVQGVSLNRFLQNTNAFVIKGAVTSQILRDQQVKAGVEMLFTQVKFGAPGYLVQTTVDGVQQLVPKVDDPPDYPPISVNNPISFAVYAQDQIEWNDLTLRIGARYEYFDARTTIPGDLANPANSIAGAPTADPVPTTKKSSIAPRLGVSYPITTTSAIFFAYGHFYQMPGLGQIFSNSDYSILERLQAGGISYGVMGNPDIEPERTVQYEMGYKNALTDFLGLDVSIFYKDIRDLLGVEFISTYTAAEYARLTNIDYGNVYGFTISLDQRRLGIVSTTIDYTFQLTQGNSSDPNETANRAAAGEDPRPRQIPLNWDQRHTLNLTFTLSQPNDYIVSMIARFSSGQPYTPSVGSGFGAQLEANSGVKPTGLLIDLRAEKYFSLGAVNFSVFARVFNLLDNRFNNGFVFANTGSPDYSLTPITDQATLANPLRYYAPRRIEVGVTLNSSL